MGIGLRWLIGITAAACLCATASAQQPLPDGTGGGGFSAPGIAPHPSTLDASHTGLYHDLDLLRRNGFTQAEQASVLLRVFDHAGVTPANLQKSDFTLIVNGTPREARLRVPGSSTSAVPALVLLVLPPNEPIVHSIAIRNAEKYFAAQPGELLPWKVGIFDSNGKMTPFTDGRSQLLANLNVVDHTVEPFQYASSAGLSMYQQWDSTWMMRAEEAIGMMQRFDGPKVILAINPLAERQFGLNDQMFAHDGPETLTPVAKTIGAHIYVANVGGPEVYIPSGGAADDRPAQINTPAGPVLGNSPSYHMQVDPQMVSALNFFAYRTSEMMQAAADTFGGYANSLQELAGKIHRDLDGSYALDFDMTAEDTDKGVPTVEVRLARHDLKVAIVDVVPIGAVNGAPTAVASKQLMDTVRKATARPVSSPDYRIAQHVDYFPLHEGVFPVLPMSANIAWTGAGKARARLLVVESVEDPNLASVILERAIEVRWNGQNLSWERDGQLRPGNYVWRIAVHDGNGKVFASAEEKIAVGMPRQSAIAISSLVLGKACRDAAANPSGLQHRPEKGAALKNEPQPTIDPMHAADCRVKPEATDNFAPSDMLHAFVRIYPSEKLDKHHPEVWTAKFVLRAGKVPGTGTVELEEDLPFSTDSGSGYLAAIEMPLNGAPVTAGPHTLAVEMHGPGMRSDLKASRAIDIVR